VDQDLQGILIFVSFLVSIGCVTTLIKAWITSRTKRAPELDGRVGEILERLTRLETTVDTTALEVERIAEGQRFTTKLLASRPQPVAAREDAEAR
jgi:hypothetical protein